MPVRERNAVPTEATDLIESGNPVTDWRYGQLIKHGLDPERANQAALDKDFDIERFRALRLADCPADLVYDIVR